MNPSTKEVLPQQHGGGGKLQPRRRNYSTAFKLQVLREIMAPGASISRVALRHNMNSNVIFRWRREFQTGELTGDGPLERPPADENQFAAIGIVDSQGIVALLPPPEKDGAEQQVPERRRGRVELVLPNGIRIYIEDEMEDSTLRRILLVVKELP